VIGAGTMGAGLASVFARGGSAVRLCARRESRLTEAVSRFPDLAETALLTTSIDDALAGAGLVVETIVEEVEPKREVLATAERLASDEAILVSNTSSLPLAALSAGLARPERFAGLHWFNPPELVEIVEVVGTDDTAPETLEALRGWMELLGKAPVVLRRDVPGFVANRLQYALIREAWDLVERGICSFDDVDRTITRGLGPRWAAVGPFESLDLAGLDIHLAVARNLFGALSEAHEPPVALVDTVARGTLGAKSGEGLLGLYTPDRAARIAMRRTRIAHAIAAARDREEHHMHELADLAAADRPSGPAECAALAEAAAARLDTASFVRVDEHQRIYELLWRDEHSEGWLLSWWEARDTGYHDHDGSAGAVHVVAGRVSEEPLVLSGAAQVSDYGTGDSFSFTGDRIHRMHHDPEAVTIHVYSPPLRRLGSYEVVGGVLMRAAGSPDEETPATPTVDAARATP
jgi:3-hydroxybutyryl-CoA dehydrogenase